MSDIGDVQDAHRLMFCVLERSLKDIIKWHHPVHSKNSSFSDYEEGVNWLLGKGVYSDESLGYIFSYPYICKTLNLPADNIRLKIINIMEGIDVIPEQLLGGSLWRHGHSRSAPGSLAEHFISESTLFLFPPKQVSDDESEWNWIPERETLDSEDESPEEKDEYPWD